MKTVVFTDNIDFTINHQVKVIGDPINDKKHYEEGALFNRVHDLREISFFVPAEINEYNAPVKHVKVILNADQIKSLAAMIEKIETLTLEPGIKELDDDLPF